jgi:hypothetical protein
MSSFLDPLESGKLPFSAHHHRNHSYGCICIDTEESLRVAGRRGRDRRAGGQGARPTVGPDDYRIGLRRGPFPYPFLIEIGRRRPVPS